MEHIHPRIADRATTLHILRAFHLRASKRLGQNFLVDPSVVQCVVEGAEVHPGDRVLEIGPGIGTLTQALAEAGADVTAVELDKKLPAVLAQTLQGYPNIRILQGDVLKMNLLELMEGTAFKVAANLPYYITTPILMSLLEQRLPISHIATMVQREVAERMTARPGSKSYGALSIAVQYYTEPRILRDVPPSSFVPAPEVTSSVIVCRLRETPAVAVKDEALFFRMTRAAFGQRRKTLANALRSTGFPKESLQESLSRANIDPSRRGETLSLMEFARLADALADESPYSARTCK